MRRFCSRTGNAVPSPCARRHILFSFAPKLRADIIHGAPTDPVLHDKAKDSYIKVFRPLEVMTFQGGVIDPQNFTAPIGISAGDYQLDAIAIKIIKIKIVPFFCRPILFVGVNMDLPRC